MTREEKNKKFNQFSHLLDQFADLRAKWKMVEGYDSEDKHKLWTQMDTVRMKLWKMVDTEDDE